MASDADDPVASGSVSSLARPGRNVTGLTSFARGLSGKRLELLKEMFPKASRVAVLSNIDNPRHQVTLKELELAAPPLRITLQSLVVRGTADFEIAFRAAAKSRADALMVPTDSLFTGHQKMIAKLALDNRLPTTYDRDDFVEAGGLVSYGVEQDDLYRRSAYYVDKILRGTKPADLPVEQPTKFELVINLKTAKALGLTVPPSLLALADEVIE
jgi:putative ABC transport system substrate-binding protein